VKSSASGHTPESHSRTDEHPQICRWLLHSNCDAVVVLTSPGPGQTMLHSFVKKRDLCQKGRTTLSALMRLKLCSNLAETANGSC